MSMLMFASISCIFHLSIESFKLSLNPLSPTSYLSSVLKPVDDAMGGDVESWLSDVSLSSKNVGNAVLEVSKHAEEDGVQNPLRPSNVDDVKHEIIPLDKFSSQSMFKTLKTLKHSKMFNLSESSKLSKTSNSSKTISISHYKMSSPQTHSQPINDSTSFNTALGRHQHNSQTPPIQIIHSGGFHKTSYTTLVPPYFQIDLIKDGFGVLKYLKDDRKEDRFKGEKYDEKVDGNGGYDKDGGNKEGSNNEVTSIKENGKKKEVWSDHKYFTLNEMKVLRRYLIMLRSNKSRGEGKKEDNGAERDPGKKRKNVENIDGLVVGSMATDRKEGMTEDREEILTQLIQELWMTHSSQSDPQQHIYQLKSFTPHDDGKNNINKVVDLKNSLDEIVSHTKTHNKSHSSQHGRGRMERRKEMEELRRLSLIFSLTQPVGHHFFTDHEVKILDQLFHSSFQVQENHKYLHNLPSIVQEVSETFTHAHTHPYEFHTKKLKLEWLWKAPLEWLSKLLLPLLASLNSLDLSSNDLDLFASHFFSSSSDPSETRSFIMQPQSSKQLQVIQQKLNDMFTLYPHLDSLIDRHCDVIKYLTHTQDVNLQRYRRMETRGCDGDDFDCESDGVDDDEEDNATSSGDNNDKSYENVSGGNDDDRGVSVNEGNNDVNGGNDDGNGGEDEKAYSYEEGGVAYDEGGVEYDEGGVEYDEGGVDYDEGGVDDDGGGDDDDKAGVDDDEGDYDEGGGNNDDENGGGDDEFEMSERINSLNDKNYDRLHSIFRRTSIAAYGDDEPNENSEGQFVEEGIVVNKGGDGGQGYKVVNHVLGGYDYDKGVSVGDNNKKQNKRVEKRKRRNVEKRFRKEKEGDVERDEEEEDGLLLNGRRVSMERLFEKVEKIREASVELMEKEKNLLDFLDFKNINHFFRQFDVKKSGQKSSHIE